MNRIGDVEGTTAAVKLMRDTIALQKRAGRNTIELPHDLVEVLLQGVELLILDARADALKATG